MCAIQPHAKRPLVVLLTVVMLMPAGMSAANDGSAGVAPHREGPGQWHLMRPSSQRRQQRAVRRTERRRAKFTRKLRRLERRRARRSAGLRVGIGVMDLRVGIPGLEINLPVPDIYIGTTGSGAPAPRQSRCDEGILSAVLEQLERTDDAEMVRGLAEVLERAGCSGMIEFEVEAGPARVPAEVGLPHDILAPSAPPAEYDTVVEAPEPPLVVVEAPEVETPRVATITEESDRGSSAINGDFEKVEWEILELVNAIRTKAGLTSLTYDPRLQAAGINHSVEMYQMEYFSHTSPVTERANFATRISLEGISDFGVAGENLVMGPDAKNLAKRFVDIWMDSPGHRANILGEDFRFSGVGVYGEGERVYATQLFSARVNRGPEA